MDIDLMYYGLSKTTKEINSNFKIKVSGMVYRGNKKIKVHTLVGVHGLIRLVGDYRKINKMLKKVFECKEDKKEFKLYERLKVTFYS